MLKKTQIYEIIKAVKGGKTTVDKWQNNTRRKDLSGFGAEITAEVEVDRQTTIQKLVAAHRVWMRMIELTLHKDLDLSKKSGRWVLKLLTSAHKNERIQTYEEFMAMVRLRSMAMLDRIVTNDKSPVSFHMPEA
jgi:hypothetical protein